MKTICFVGNLSHAFVNRDFSLLSKYFNLDVIEPAKSWLGWFIYPFITAKKVKQNTLVFAWFAGWHSLFPIFFSKLFKKKSIVVVGGYDAANEPAIDYGAFNDFRKKISAKYVLKSADILLAVSVFNKNEIIDKINHKNIQIIYNGVNLLKFPPPTTRKKNTVVTVGGIKKGNIKRKGLITFVETAKYLPEIQFRVIGKDIDGSINHLKSIASPNVDFLGEVSEEELVQYFLQAKVVCQLSYYESFGLAPAEGMACGCVPVLSKERMGVSEIISDLGFYVPYGDAEKTAEAIRKALQSQVKIQKEMRKRIEEKCNLKKREQELKHLIVKILKSEGK